MPNKAIPLAVMGVGVIFAWSGLNNQGITTTIQSIVQGKKPTPGPGMSFGNNIGGIVSGAVVSGPNPMGQQIATDALAYNGAGYVWGGAPANGIGQWDCSSFANWVIGHDVGLAIPGYAPGTYTGATHGPATLAWLASIGSVVNHIPRSELAAGDIACWQTHMGIALNNTQMISAENPSQGTAVATINGFIPGEVLVCLRLRGVTQPVQSGGGKKK